MSEYLFGVTREKLSARECKRRDRICCEEGGWGYTQANIPGTGWQGWFSAPNRGSPFDADLERRVLERVERPS